MPNTPAQDQLVAYARIRNIVLRIEAIANDLSALHASAVHLNLTPDYIEDAIASLEQFIDQESSDEAREDRFKARLKT